jgi:hypothetical protein
LTDRVIREVSIAVEGTTDAAVVKRLLREARLSVGPEYVTGGKHAIDGRLRSYNSAARLRCWLVLRDLDHDAACAPDLVRRLLPAPAAHMRLHTPVRAVEAWLLADAEAIGRSLLIPKTRIPADPEAIAHPKRALVDLARGSRSATIRQALVPATGTRAAVGPGYAAFLIEFATKQWRPATAAKRSESLARLREFLREVAAGSQKGC